MPSLTAKDRVSLCLFTFTDGRRCRTPRISSHPHFCFYHAQKESQSQATAKLAKDLAYFFSGDYLSANDLNTALGRLIPAVIRGEIKPRVARTVAYMLQTLLQSTRLAQHEYINAFGTGAWRETVSSSINSNHDHLYPPDPNDPDPENESDDESEDESNDDPEPQQPTPASSVGPWPARPDCPSRPAQPTEPRPTPRPSPPPPTLKPPSTSLAPSFRPHPTQAQHHPPYPQQILPPNPRHHHLNRPPQTATPTKSASTIPTAS
jgi:hypothetical protein